jgi:hypothetical protein
MVGIVDFIESGEKPGQCPRCRGNATPHLDFSRTQESWLNAELLMSDRFLNPKHLLRQPTAELSMEPTGISARERHRMIVLPVVNRFLYFDVRYRLLL